MSVTYYPINEDAARRATEMNSFSDYVPGSAAADDSDAIQKLEQELAEHVKLQKHMKSANAYFRRHRTLEGCPNMAPERIRALTEFPFRLPDTPPYLSFQLINNSARIGYLRDCIRTLTCRETSYTGWKFEGGEVVINLWENRMQLLFNSRPDESIRTELKQNDFQWSPRAGAWQRQLSDDAIRAADSIQAIWPVSGEKPSELQHSAQKASQKEETIMRYYSTQRPVAPGTFPKPEGNKILEIHNFDEKTYCKEPGRDCWGYIEYEKPLSEKEAHDYELVRDRLLDFSQRYMATAGTSFLRTFATAAELNEWWEARDTEGRYFCRLYDREKGIDILGSRYMFLSPEERFHDEPEA